MTPSVQQEFYFTLLVTFYKEDKWHLLKILLFLGWGTVLGTFVALSQLKRKTANRYFGLRKRLCKRGFVHLD
jgi:hypothetical protein